MSLTLTPDTLAAAYEFLRTTPPFNRWSLPPADEVEFRVGAERDCFGWHSQPEPGRHRVSVSTATVGHTDTLVAVLAHEMIHLFQACRKTHTRGADHNTAFYMRARQVCRHHGFDPKAF